MADRRAELERKRQKLALIRAQKESNRRREQPSNPIILQGEAGKENNINSLRLETEELLTHLGFSSDSVLTKNEDSNILHTSTENANESFSVATKKMPALSVNFMPEVNIPPKEHVTYTKQTQTTQTGTERDAHTHDYYVLNWDDVLTFDDMHAEEEGEDGNSIPFGTPPLHRQTRSKSHKENGLPNVEYVKPAITPQEAEKLASEELQKTKIKKKPVELTEEEKKQILLSDEFQRFFNRSSRIMERALIQNESADIFIDYTGAKEEMDSEDKHGNTLSLNRNFQDDKWTKNRVISSFDWCTQYPELLVAAYTATEHQPNTPDGVCLIWNLKFKQTIPEYILTCQSPVMSCCFTKFHPNLIVGGTYSGQIVLWDNRSNKRTPVQRSPLSTAAHTHPIYCVQVVGTQNSHNLITVSTDGKLCSWNLDMLSAAQDTLELNQSMQSKPVAVTSMSFPNGDYNNFVLGSEEGSAYAACRHGAKAGILESYTGHQAPITSVDYNQVQGQIDFSHLFLSSSMDWTVKLWSTKEKTGKPMHSFDDNFDYVYDARWSPINPALFATVDGQGRTDLWNLNNDTELPTASITTENNTALSKLIWTPSGNQIVTGDDQGKIYLYDVGEQLAQPKNDESMKFMNTLQELKTSAEQEVEN